MVEACQYVDEAQALSRAARHAEEGRRRAARRGYLVQTAALLHVFDQQRGVHADIGRVGVRPATPDGKAGLRRRWRRDL